MSHESQSPAAQPESDLKSWVAAWPAVRRQVEAKLAQHAQRDPSLHFELTLAELELKDIDEAVRRIGSLAKIVYGDASDMGDAERYGTGT